MLLEKQNKLSHDKGPVNFVMDAVNGSVLWMSRGITKI